MKRIKRGLEMSQRIDTEKYRTKKILKESNIKIEQ